MSRETGQDQIMRLNHPGCRPRRDRCTSRRDSAGAQAQDYPTKTITLVVPFPPGGGNDAMARIMADRLTAGLGRTVVVENRATGAGIVGTRSVIKAAPDGYTLMLGHTGSIGINPDALRQRRLRSAQGFHRARADRAVVARPARASVREGQGRGGPDRARQGQSRQVQLCFLGAWAPARTCAPRCSGTRPAST